MLIPTLLLSAIAIQINPAGTGMGNQAGLYPNLMWSSYIALIAGLVIILVKRRSR